MPSQIAASLAFWIMHRTWLLTIHRRRFSKQTTLAAGIARLQMDKPDHPICLGLPRQIEFNDETYWPPTPEPAVPGYTVLASSVEKVKPGANETQSQVMFWTCQPEGGRVFGCVPGHFTWTFDDPYFRILLLRGIAWAGGSSPYRFDSLVLHGARVTRRQP